MEKPSSILADGPHQMHLCHHSDEATAAILMLHPEVTELPTGPDPSPPPVPPSESHRSPGYQHAPLAPFTHTGGASPQHQSWHTSKRSNSILTQRTQTNKSDLKFIPPLKKKRIHTHHFKGDKKVPAMETPSFSAYMFALLIANTGFALHILLSNFFFAY